MKKAFLLLLVFLFCSGFLWFDNWYEKYGIGEDEIKSIEVVPKLIDITKGKNNRDTCNALFVIARFGTKANKYYGEVTNFAFSKKSIINGHVFANAFDAVVYLFDDNDIDDLEKLVYMGITNQSKSIRYLTYGKYNHNKLFNTHRIYSDRIIEALDSLSKSERDQKIRAAASLALNTATLNKFASNKNSTDNRAVKSSLKVDSILETQDNPFAIAVVIGNMDYISSRKSVPNVDYAINDARTIKDILVNAKGYRDGNIIYLENATQADIVSTFGNKDNHQGKLFNWVRPESDVFVYYSGHGAPSLKDGSGYLLPVDADPSTVELNGYSLDSLYQNIAKLPAKSITVVIDACFSGSSQGGTITKNASSITLKPITMPKVQSSINVLSATNVGEIASWDTEAQHSLFTSYFLKALSGAADKKPYGNEDHQVDLAEVQKYVNLEVTYMARRNYGRDQNPQISGNSAFIFTSLKE